MGPSTCPHEDALLEALGTGRWPEQCDGSLRAHVAACAVCRDLALVATALAGEAADLRAQVRVPSAGAVWWRLQVRARADAERTAMRPILVAGACGATVLVATLAALVTLGLPWATALLGDGLALAASFPTVDVSLDLGPLVGHLLDRWLVHAVLAAVLLVAAPVALYLAAWE